MKIRPHAQVIITKNGKLFCLQGKDGVRNEVFYRTPGGGIDFGEYAKDAIAREMLEEFNASIINIKQIGIDENIFVYEGKAGHEITFLFTADFVDNSMHEDKFYRILDSESGDGARWEPIDLFLSGERALYPSSVLTYLTQNTD